MDKLDKLLIAAQEKVARRAGVTAYDFSRLSTETLKKIVNEEYTTEELDLILAPVKVFMSREEADRAAEMGFSGLTIIDDVP